MFWLPLQMAYWVHPVYIILVNIEVHTTENIEWEQNF